MIGISTLVYDPNGFIILNESTESSLNVSSRRVSRVATLDGGATLTDSGFTDSDKTFNISVLDISKEDAEILRTIYELYPLVRVSTKTGAYVGVISDLDTDQLPIALTFLVKEKVS